MLLNWSVMDRETAGIVAQIVPVLLLSLLFEARLKPRSTRSTLGIALGFLGNLWVAVAAIILEFGLLGTLQRSTGSRDADWMWFLLAVLFAVVLVRWAASTTAMKIAASTGALRDVLTAATQTFIGATSGMSIVMQLLATPSEVFASALRVLAQAYVATWLDLGRTARAIVSDARRGIVWIFRRK